ncbi:MAG: 4'-phosphopantetheinyl transferase family protein [Bacteroidota bacterium]
MPLIAKILPKKGDWLGIWEITESEPELCQSLEKTELEQSKSIKADKKRMEWLAVRNILDQMLPGGKITYLDNGKPEIKEGFISLSHCYPYAVVYFSGSSPVGTDIEKKSERILKIASRFLHPTDLNADQKSDIGLLTLIWCCKEAVFKKHGGDTVNFGTHIRIGHIDSENHRVSVQITNESAEKEEVLFYQLIGDFVLAYTQ